MSHITPGGKGLGWRPSLPDHRDALYRYTPPIHVAINLPPQVQLSDLPIWDQGQLGSCTGNGIAFCLLYDAVRQGLLRPEDVPSRLMIYWGERSIEGTINSDAGANIRDGIKFVSQSGACLETDWPYDISRFRDRPPDSCWQHAKAYQALSYYPVGQNVQLMKACLAEGFPFVFGFTCFSGLDSVDTAQHGLLPMPAPNEAPLGGHCVVAVGYDETARYFRCRNSWSPSWGDSGYFYMPFEYLARPDLASDFWTIRVIG
jgi:C1A family cysteine protease